MRGGGGKSDAEELGKGVEVGVARVEGEAVLEGEGGNPDVVGGDGRALASELDEEARVGLGGGVVWVEDADARGEQEAGREAKNCGLMAGKKHMSGAPQRTQREQRERGSTKEQKGEKREE